MNMKRFTIYIFSVLILFSVAHGQNRQSEDNKGFALFSILKDTLSSNPYKFHFKDKSNGNIISWKWDFGDGETSEKKEDTHEYTEPGIYNVCLTIETEENGEIEESVTCKKVRVAEEGFFNLGGHVFVNHFPIEGGVAYLYAFNENNKLRYVDSCQFDSIGFYYFYQQIEGRYVIKAEASHELGQYASYMPTYYGNETKWQDAEVIQFDSTMWEYNISLSRTSFNYSGDGEISGTISYDSTDLRDFSATDIPIYIIDEDERHSCTYSETDGTFTFENLHHGDYQIRAEITGMHSVPVYQNINSDNQEDVSISLLIQEDQVIADVPEDVYNTDVDISQPYPNPATDHISMKISSEKGEMLKIKIFDQMGRLVYSAGLQGVNGEETITINTGSFANGVYNMQVSSDRRGSTNRLFIKK